MEFLRLHHKGNIHELPFYDQQKVIKFYEQAINKNVEEQKNDEIVIFLLLSMCLLKDQYNVKNTT